jgi:hypothetical protein
MLTKSPSSSQNDTNFNEGPAENGTLTLSTLTSSSNDRDELFKQRVLSWLNDVSEKKKLHPRITTRESIETYMASTKSFLDRFDAAIKE